MEDRFADIAADYDMMFPRDFDEDSRMLGRLFEGRGVKTVLDCACGTGPHVAMLARQGYQVTGSDSSESMLSLARARQASEGFEATFVRAAWEELPGAVGGAFDAVICIGNSLPLAGSDEDVEWSLAGMCGVVARGGLLVVQNRNMDLMRAERPGAVLTDAVEAGTYTLFVFEYSGDLVTYKTFYLVPGAGQVAAYGEFPMNLLTRSKLEGMLRRTGAGSWRVYGDARLSRFSARRSSRLVLAVEC